jgi:hypothetical protein
MGLVAVLRMKTRADRLAAFKGFLNSMGKVRPLDTLGRLRIIDIGGTVPFWEDWWKLTDADRLDVTLINIHATDVSVRGRTPKYKCITDVNRDATTLTANDFQHFDVVFSNSFFEHLANLEARALLAASILASGVPFFIQVPNKYSPVDPHFPFAPPFFAAYPTSIRTRLCTLSSFGSGWRAPSLAAARKAAQFYNPLGPRDMRKLFPGAIIAIERPFFVPMSILAYANAR